MSRNNGTRHETAFTVSIEAREGVTTGISAHDRAHTIAVATDPEKGADDVVSPGHVFPLVAKAGGVLVRAGHTEAAVDICRLAGLHAAGVICEVMSDDGSMARLPELKRFARVHGLKIGTIADLIAYRRKTERCLERVYEQPFDSIHASGLHLIVYRSLIDGTEHVAITKGVIDPERPALVRMHQNDFANDMLGLLSERQDYIPRALQAIGDEEGAGAVVFIRDPRQQALSSRFMTGNMPTLEETIRDYGTGAEILVDLGVRQMTLLTSQESRLPSIEGYGLSIVGRRPLPPLRGSKR